MRLYIKNVWPLFLLLSLALPAWAQQEVPIWSDGLAALHPGRTEVVEDKHETGRIGRYISFVNTPTLIHFPVACKKAAPGEAVKLYQHVMLAGGSAELHMFHQGEHGFGVSPPAGSVRGWTVQYANWLRDVAGAQ